jgi:hypothetical protein
MHRGRGRFWPSINQERLHDQGLASIFEESFGSMYRTPTGLPKLLIMNRFSITTVDCTASFPDISYPLFSLNSSKRQSLLHLISRAAAVVWDA